MAIYHLSITTLGRAGGALPRSAHHTGGVVKSAGALGKASYLAGERLVDRDGKVVDYRSKAEGVEYVAHILPGGRTFDPEILWNLADNHPGMNKATAKRADPKSLAAFDLIVAVPRELKTVQQREASATELCRWIADHYRAAVSVGGHVPDVARGSSADNWHFHALISARECTPHGQLTRTAPVLSATLPRTGERIAATVAPVTSRPTSAIRKPPAVTFELSAFAPKESASSNQAKAVLSRHRRPAAPGEDTVFGALRAAVEERRNILIAGSTGSGKISLLSSLLALPSVRADRCLVLDDTQEIRIEAPDHVRMLTSADVGMRTLVQLSLRYRPDRIILGEVRSGDAAMELIHAMNTGHSGSFCTVHANSARDALGRLEDLCAEVCSAAAIPLDCDCDRLHRLRAAHRRRPRDQQGHFRRWLERR